MPAPTMLPARHDSHAFVALSLWKALLHYNYTPGRTQAEVIELFDCAITPRAGRHHEGGINAHGVGFGGRYRG